MLLTRLLIEFLRISGRPLVGYDLDPREPALAGCFPSLVWPVDIADTRGQRSEEHTSELQSQSKLVCRLLPERKLPVELETYSYLRVVDEPAAVAVLAHVATDPVFFFNDPATTEIYTLSLHDALPIKRPTTAPMLKSPMAQAASEGRMPAP